MFRLDKKASHGFDWRMNEYAIYLEHYTYVRTGGALTFSSFEDVEDDRRRLAITLAASDASIPTPPRSRDGLKSAVTELLK